MMDRATGRPWVSLAWAVLLVAVVIALTPYLWMVLASFKTRVDLLSSAPKWIFAPTLANYPAVFVDKGYWPLVINSLVIAGSSTALCIVIGAPAAYVFARSDFPGKEDLFFFFLTTRMAPPISVVWQATHFLCTASPAAGSPRSCPPWPAGPARSGTGRAGPRANPCGSR